MSMHMTCRRTVPFISSIRPDSMIQRKATQVLEEIAFWLGDSYRNKILLNGIIYAHRITDIRMQGSAKANLLMFRQLCGQDALKKVVLVTTMWDRVTNEEGVKRETELINTPEFWGRMLEKGSSSHRHDNTKASARDIVHLLAHHNASIATDLQKQLVDERRRLDQTSAGRELQSEMLKQKEKWTNELRQIEKQMKAQHDQETEEMMREERDRYRSLMKKVENDTDSLRSTMENLLAQRDKRVSRMEKKLQEQQAAHENELRRIKDRQRRLEREKKELEEQREQEKKAQRKLEKKAGREREREEREE